MLGPCKERRVERLVPLSLEAAVPADHFYRHLEAVLDLSFVRAWVADCYAAGGRPSIDPVVFFKLQLILFFEGVRSERQLMRVVEDRLSLRWYLGYAFDERLPDHSSLTRIRERLGLPLFQRFFEHVVELCQQAGLVEGNELFFDATNVRANADLKSLLPLWYQRARRHLDELFADTAPAPAGADSTSPAESLAAVEALRIPRPLPRRGTEGEQQRLATRNQGTWKLLAQQRLDPARPLGRNKYQRLTGAWVSTTDPDATPLRDRDRAVLGYRDHYVVDGGRARIILGALVTPADVMENQAMQDLLHQARFRWHLHVRHAVGDAAYGTIENIRALEAQGIRAYVPLRIFEKRRAYFPASRFTYDGERDEYRCPQGQRLRRDTTLYVTEHVLYRADPAVCHACPVKGACTPGRLGRTIQRSFHAEYIERVRGYHATAAYQQAMRKRAVWVEPLFGEAKDWHGLRRVRLRGLWKVNCVALLIAAGQNLKRWLSKTGWGRRSGPAGCFARSPSTSSGAPEGGIPDHQAPHPGFFNGLTVYD
jgi:transposase